MKNSRCYISAICSFCVVISVAVSGVQAQDAKRLGKGINPATIAAYQKLGAVYGGIRQFNEFHFEFLAGKDNATKYLPAFHFAEDPKTDLPDVDVHRVAEGPTRYGPREILYRLGG